MNDRAARQRRMAEEDDLMAEEYSKVNNKAAAESLREMARNRRQVAQDLEDQGE